MTTPTEISPTLHIADDACLTPEDLLQAIRAVGIRTGDTVMFHVCHSTLGRIQDCTNDVEEADAIVKILLEAVGKTGTALVPTYTFSFCRGEIFDVQATPAVKGPWSTSVHVLEQFRLLPGAVRSQDPIHSIAGVGPLANALLCDVPHTCFGEGSVFDRLRRHSAKVCVIGAPLEEATFRHHAEEVHGVPFRFKKLFTGYIRDNNTVRKAGWIYYVRLRAENGYPDGSHLESEARKAGACLAAPAGAGEVLGAQCAEYFDLTLSELGRNSWCTARGPAGDPVVLDNAGTAKSTVALSADASMMDIVDALWKLPRDIVSDGYDVALRSLGALAPLTIHEYPTGSECWGWIVPEKWACQEAYLETLDGRQLFSYADHPLHVVSYSLPFEGEVSRETLFEHLYVHPVIPGATPFIFKYYERDWGLCCSQNLKDSLAEDRYRVVIRTSFHYSTLKVGEIVVPGESEESIVLCAHLCHPHMVNDDLSGVVVGIDTMRQLLKGPQRRYTYRFIIVPETIGSIAYLSHNEHLIKSMKGGLFLEMLGRSYPHSLQLSFDGATDLDMCFSLAMKESDPSSWTGAYRTIIGNDERQFNGPGVRVPMLSLSRVLPAGQAEAPYREYHSSSDTPALVPDASLQQSRDLVLKFIETLENNAKPVNHYKGEPFCSRYGLHIDPRANPEGNRSLFQILDLIDGSRSIAEIAVRCGISFRAVRDTISELVKCGLVSEPQASGQ